MLLKISVLIAAISQVIAAAYLSIGTFEMSTRELPALIQPAGWAFSIWGVIYALSFVYAIYQIIPKYDNELLRATRLPTLIGFVGSIAWLYFAGTSDWLTWLTIPILFIMAIALTYVVRAKNTGDRLTDYLSKSIILPYAAWAGIAAWVNVHALLLDRDIITTANMNIVVGIVLFTGLASFTTYYFRKSGYSAWYGSVMIWASIAVVAASYQRADWLFVIVASLFAFGTLALYLQKRLRS